jgi:hypothetical protein
VKPWPYGFLNGSNQLCRKELNAYPWQEMAYVLEARRTTKSQHPSGRVLLETHLAHVENAIQDVAGIDKELKEALRTAAKFHDYGKADIRYQAWLFGSDLMAAQYAPKFVAKSSTYPLGILAGLRFSLIPFANADHCRSGRLALCRAVQNCPCHRPKLKLYPSSGSPTPSRRNFASNPFLIQLINPERFAWDEYGSKRDISHRNLETFRHV